jgi:hypothetical protein
MKLIVILFVLLTQTLLAQYNFQNLSLDTEASSAVYQFENLRLYPIRANQVFVAAHREVGQYLTLKEALENKKIVITETATGRGEGGTVNTLLLENVSTEPIMILTGEVVEGGKQDRMMAKDVVIHPRSGKVKVDVYCVEHGRWQARKEGMSFNSYSTVSSNEVRKAGAVNKDQREVWNKVAETNAKNRVESSTGTLTALDESGTFKNLLVNYKNHFQAAFDHQDDIVGIVAVSGEKVLGCDMFASHDLFIKQYPNLVNAYAAEAITSGSKVTITRNLVEQYLHVLLNDESKQELELEKRGTVLKDKGKKVHLSAF